jgi:hypothetical protein
MGLFRRAANKSGSSFWKQAAPVMAANEVPVEYAHLRCVSGSEDSKGTLFLTSEQVIWRIADPRVPRGYGFEVPIRDLKAVGRVVGIDDPGSFGLGMESNGEVGMLLFLPQHPKDPANVALAENMARAIHEARKQLN